MKPQQVKQVNIYLCFLIVVSVFGLLLSIFLVVHPASIKDNFPFRNLVAGSAFSLICISGIWAALFPSSCKAIPKLWKSNKNGDLLDGHETTLRAHHPLCDNYSAHILSIGNMKFCATCSGLLVGAIFVLLGTALCFFGNLHIGEPSTLVWVGTAGVTLGLLQSAFPKFSNGLTRFLASGIFVVGTFLLLVSINETTMNVSVDLFFIAVSLLWILTKIAFSQRDHQKICSLCTKKCCI
jgi:ABC-type Fe3+-siderophore transport system permease subunit